MFAAITRGPRRRLSTRITAGALASLTAGLALATAGTASADVATAEQPYTIKPSDSIKVSINCPDNAPFLIDQSYTGWRYAVNGIEIIENGGVGVSIVNAYTIQNRLAVGAWGTATNWDPTKPQDIIIKAHCTSLRSQSYKT